MATIGTASIPAQYRPQRGSGAPILRLENVTKRFGGLTAVNEVSLQIYPGEVVALVGDNGAGKSTLIKMISGVYKPDDGQIFLEDREITMTSPMEARSLGIETIYQDLALCENLDASVNIFLGREPSRRLLGLFKQVDRAQDAVRIAVGAQPARHPHPQPASGRSARCRAASARRWPLRAPSTGMPAW